MHLTTDEWENPASTRKTTKLNPAEIGNPQNHKLNKSLTTKYGDAALRSND